MKDIALLALFYGVQSVSKTFGIEEYLILEWVQKLEGDEFFKNLRNYILAQLTHTESSQIMKKYSISANVLSKALKFQENLMDVVEKEEKPQMKPEKTLPDTEDAETKIEILGFDEKMYQIEEWHSSDEVFIVNFSDFLTDITKKPQPAQKKVKSSKHPIISEIIKDGLPLYKETAVKFGEKPRQVKEWLKSYQSDGKLQEKNLIIRPASSIFQQAFDTLDKI